LGVIRSVNVHDGHVRIEFTPTFLGCPALEVMKRAMEEKVAELGAQPDVEVISDDSWSTDRITPAGREKLREAGFAPPAPREATAPGPSSRMPSGASTTSVPSRTTNSPVPGLPRSISTFPAANETIEPTASSRCRSSPFTAASIAPAGVDPAAVRRICLVTVEILYCPV